MKVSYGLPVITANNSSLPEVGGNAAFYIDTKDTDAMALMMKKVLEMSPAELAKVKDKEQEQLKHFSWKKNSDEMMDVLYDLVN